MPNIGKVSERLRTHYDKAVKVRFQSVKNELVPISKKKDRKAVRKISLRSEEIVYLEASPDYCRPDTSIGHKGTLLRNCDPDNRKICQNLCEECGYRTVKRTVYEQNCEKCRKQFEWCCTVSCGKCKFTRAQCMQMPTV